MAGMWFPAFVVATVAALIATPLLARRAASGSRRRARLATAAGPLIAVMAALPFALGELDAEVSVGLVGAVWLWFAGQLVDRQLLPKVLRRFAIGAAAALVVASGLRLEVSGVGWIDIVLTVGIVWLATSAWRSAETRDALLLGWAASIAAGAAMLGGLDGQADVAVVGAAVVGASLGFLPYVVGPVTARLRTGGALFLGFLTAVLACAAEPSAPAPVGTLAPLLLLALPLIEATLAGAARVRGRGDEARTLGLAGRWRALGLSRLATTIGLVVVQAGLAFLALLVGRGVLDPAPAVALAAIVLLLVVGPALAARLDRPRGRWPRWALGLALLIVGALVVLSAPAALALLRARTDTTAAADAATRGLAAARRGDAVASKAAFSEAERRFTQARLRLTDPVASLGLQVPVLGPNLRAARDLTAVGIGLSRAGRQLSSTADPEQLRIVDATVNLAELERLRPEFESTARTLSAARRQVADIDTTFLIAPVEDAITKLDRRLARAARDSRTAAIASRVLPGVLGGEGPRRYFLAVRNNAEARATGGFLGNWGTITAANGRLDLGDFERGPLLNPESFEAPRTVTAPADYLGRYERFRVDRQIQNASVSPDVPTVSAVEAGLLSQSVVGAVDGVVNIDPVGLASVLEVTGPIEVPPWPEPISADNVVDISLRDSYIRFADDNDAREEFIGDVADAAWEAFSNRDLGSPANLVKALSKATRNKHLTLWFADPAAQRLAERARADGAVPRRPTDLMLLTTQNAGGNKIDTFLRRRVDYSVDLTPSPDGKRVIANARFVATLQNTAPATGYPPYIIGPNTPTVQAGENYTFLTAYSELPLTRATLDGQVTGLQAERELGRWAYSNYFSLLAETTKTLDLTLDGKLRLGADGTYSLALVRQPTVIPDTVAVTVRLPDGWRFGAADNVRVSADRRTARFSGPLDRDRILRMQIEQDRGTGLWARLQDGR